MVLRILSRGAIAAVIGATMLAASSVPSSAFTLASPSLEQPVASADVQSVWWHGGWHGGLAWRLAPRMGLASRLWLGRRLASLGLGAAGARDMASLRSTIAGGARGAAAAASDARDRDSAARRAALALHLLQ